MKHFSIKNGIYVYERKFEDRSAVIFLNGTNQKQELDLTAYKEKVIENVQGLSAISEQNAASNEEVNSNIHEIISEVQTVNDNCGKMNNMAQELEKSVSYFQN